jgi:hypothetical protein
MEVDSLERSGFRAYLPGEMNLFCQFFKQGFEHPLVVVAPRMGLVGGATLGVRVERASRFAESLETAF